MSTVADAYDRDRTVRVREELRKRGRASALAATHGWYDVLVTVADHPHVKRALAGRFENGRGQHQRSAARPMTTRGAGRTSLLRRE